MRAILLLLILVVVVAIAAVATGFIDINQTRPARAPDVDATARGIEASGGQTPKFEIDTGQVAVGSRDATVKLPAINVRPADAAPQGAQPGAPQQNAQQNSQTGAPQQNAQQGGVGTTNSTQQ